MTISCYDKRHVNDNLQQFFMVFRLLGVTGCGWGQDTIVPIYSVSLKIETRTVINESLGHIHGDTNRTSDYLYSVNKLAPGPTHGIIKPSLMSLIMSIIA